jgi:hypothetical protein
MNAEAFGENVTVHLSFSFELSLTEFIPFRVMGFIYTISYHSRIPGGGGSANMNWLTLTLGTTMLILQ